MVDPSKGHAQDHIESKGQRWNSNAGLSSFKVMLILLQQCLVNCEVIDRCTGDVNDSYTGLSVLP